MATIEQRVRLRRMVDEPDTDTATYSDADLDSYVDRHGGDLHGAAADIWDEKAATASADFDFTADGGTLARSQRAIAYRRNAADHRKRMRPRTARLHSWDNKYDSIHD